MSELTIEYGSVDGYDDFSKKVETDQLVHEIESITKQFQDGLDGTYGVDVVNVSGDRMTVGFDGREGFLMHQPANGDGWTRTSLGDPRRQDTKVFYLPVYTELRGKYLVPTPKVLQALRHWADRGELGNEVQWTTD